MEGVSVSAHKRPEPLMTRAKVTAAVAGLASLCVTLGVLPATVGDQINSTTGAVTAAFGLVMSTVPAILHAVSARGAVTPTADPRTDDGVRLVPVGSAPATLDAATVLAETEAIHPA